MLETGSLALFLLDLELNITELLLQGLFQLFLLLLDTSQLIPDPISLVLKTGGHLSLTGVMGRLLSSLLEDTLLLLVSPSEVVFQLGDHLVLLF